MNPLSEALRDLMDRRKMTGAKLAEEIGISATSVSQILTGKTKPRQVTLSRLIKVLCDSAQDEQALLAAYESLGDAKIPTTPVVDDEQNAATEDERVRRFMEMKATAVAFRKQVVAALDKLKLPYQQDVASGGVITDLLIERSGKRIALECRANVKRDLEKSLVSARIVRDGLKCDRVFIVVPEFNSDLRDGCFSEDDIRDVELRHLASELSNLSNQT
jgi:transcriptional regulator with XRE-family HTH domain